MKVLITGKRWQKDHKECVGQPFQCSGCQTVITPDMGDLCESDSPWLYTYCPVCKLAIPLTPEAWRAGLRAIEAKMDPPKQQAPPETPLGFSSLLDKISSEALERQLSKLPPLSWEVPIMPLEKNAGETTQQPQHTERKETHA